MKDHAGIPTTPLAAEDARRDALAQFLRGRRESLRPQTPAPRRRTPGLRREEVAAAAGISVTWYTWLEQRRDVSVSDQTLRGLTRALDLNETEAHYLASLARPCAVSAPATGDMPDSLLQLVAGLAPHPAYAMDRVCDVVACNAPATDLFGPFKPGDPVLGNVLARLFLDPEWKRLFVDWPAIARNAVAQFRAATAPFAQDADVTGLISRLRKDAPAFNTVWQASELAPPPDWTKVLRRGDRSETWRYTVLRPEGEARAWTVTLYLPVSPPADVAAP